MRNPSFVRHYDSVLRALVARGHEVELATERPGKESWPPWVLELAGTCPSLRLSITDVLTDDPWFELVTRLRQARFYLRFLEPRYHGMPALLQRARDRAPVAAIRLAETFPVGRAGRRLLISALDVLEAAARTPASFYSYLRERRPDVVVLTPLVILKTSQLDLARAAQELGIRNVFAVASWDHLSSKGELSFSPQQVIVWNETQKREAMELHHLDATRIAMTGSQVFDDWFEKTPSTTRDAFCARVGLRPDRPILLYVCSALLEGSPPEADFVRRWVKHLRHSGHEAMRECGILVRPHFKRGEEWRGIDFGEANVVCWPPAGAVPADAASKTDYFDSMYHAAAVVGLNTSAMIEAGIVGRPVHTVLLPEFRDNQEGTVHFNYLLDGPDALLHATRSLEAHARDIAETLDGRDPDPGRSARFVRTFVRPLGVDVAATTRFVETVEALAAQPAPRPVPVPRWTTVVRPFLRPFAAAAAERVRLLKEERRRQKDVFLDEHRKRKAGKATAQAQDAP